MTVIELPDEQAEALKAGAAARGVTLEAWLKQLSEFAMPGAALDWSRCAAVERVPERVGGAWIFRNSRLPVAVVFENLEDGVTIDELVEIYEGLTREMVEAVLDFAARSLSASPALSL